MIEKCRCNFYPNNFKFCAAKKNYIICTLFVDALPKTSFLTNQNVTVSTKYLFNNILFHIFTVKAYEVHTYIQILFQGFTM